MTDAQKRLYVSDLYSGPKWKKRVEKMDMGRVLAIYLDHQNDGTVPHHEEDDSYLMEPQVDKLVSDTSHRIVLGAIPPRDPHRNEDDFPIY